MSEKYVVVDQLKLNYEGLFEFTQLKNLVDSWLFEMGYDRLEKKNEETTHDDGSKSIVIELRPWKKLTDYAKSALKIRFFVTDMRKVEVTKDSTKVIVDHGKLQMIFDGYLGMDWQNRWDRPILFFFQILFDQYVFKQFTNKFYAAVTTDVHQVHAKVKSFLNMYLYEGYHKPRWG